MGRFILFFIVGPAVFGVVAAVPATADSDHGAGIEALLGKIMSAQAVSEADLIDCNLVSDDEFEELGEAVMSLMHPDETAHETMDTMMGGAGSTSLRAAHINMAQSYLGCGLSGYGMMAPLRQGYAGQGMMDSGMMNNSLINPMANNAGGTGGFSMMGFPLLGGLGAGVMMIGWLFILAFLGYWIIKSLVGGKVANNSNDTPLDVLKKRYAHGEIDKKEYEQMKQDLS